MKIVHLTASTFHGGPERQMLGLAEALHGDAETAFLSFAEGGRCAPFLTAARRQGHEASALKSDMQEEQRVPSFEFRVSSLEIQISIYQNCQFLQFYFHR